MIEADRAFGSHAEGVGIGGSRIPVKRTLPTGSVNCAKSTGRLAAGEPQANFHPSENRPAHGSVAQWGKAAQQRIHAPGLAKQRSGTLVWARRPAETKVLPTAAASASSERGARPLGVPTGMDNGQGRGIESGYGRPARKTACHPSDQRAVVPRSPRFKRLLIPSACLRRSARRSQEWVAPTVGSWLGLRCTVQVA
jgi:hypothetical protein